MFQSYSLKQFFPQKYDAHATQPKETVIINNIPQHRNKIFPVYLNYNK